ncbi:hypothetical protein J6590_021168 [Homalodisca vitripennis]|nr:hypothetical protein J6590_021168 [Homalodisca vitripennis]
MTKAQSLNANSKDTLKRVLTLLGIIDIHSYPSYSRISATPRMTNVSSYTVTSFMTCDGDTLVSRPDHPLLSLPEEHPLGNQNPIPLDSSCRTNSRRVIIMKRSSLDGKWVDLLRGPSFGKAAPERGVAPGLLYRFIRSHLAYTGRCRSKPLRVRVHIRNAREARVSVFAGGEAGWLQTDRISRNLGLDWDMAKDEIVVFVSDFLQVSKQGVGGGRGLISRKRKVLLTEDRLVVQGDRTPLGLTTSVVHRRRLRICVTGETTELLFKEKYYTLTEEDRLVVQGDRTPLALTTSVVHRRRLRICVTEETTELLLKEKYSIETEGSVDRR